ncbi:MAG: adenylyltransferase/cytidyltransferase family protein [Phycisphaerales bacterium]|nr:adenylyltransferase/cytidyltransferase family protein [Phycisphaerales bacterium]
MGQSGKILDRAELLRLRERLKGEGRTLVQCHGCFDLVHPGHIRHLRFARAQGDLLLVSITGDGFVGKGEGRPLIPEELRAENLAELDCVDLVHIDRSPTALDLLRDLQPDIYIKGSEYEHNNDPRFRAERDAVEASGGRVVFSSGDVVFSSTALIASMEHSVDPFHKRLARLTQRPELAMADLHGHIEGMRGKRLLVVGEVIRDTYVLCDQPEVAGESPVLTLRPIERREYDGGAAVIARHAAAMGARPILLTAMPRDGAAEEVRQRLTAEGVEVLSMPVGGTLPEKQRFLAGQQKVMKLDLVEPIVLDQARQRAFVEMAAEACGGGGGVDGAIVADFGLGLLGETLTRELVRRIRPMVGVMAGDVSGRRSSLLSMERMDMLFPSERELRESMRIFDEGLPAVAWKLLEHTKSGSAIIKMGPDGLVAFDRLPEPGEGWERKLGSEHIPALATIAIDPLGCGDALMTAATLTRIAGGSLLAAGFIGAVAAATQAQRLGNLPVSATDLRQGIARVHAAHLAFASAEVIRSRLPGDRAAMKAS